MELKRFPQNPIIRPHMDDRMGENINGPSLIRVPDWIEAPLGNYYLYFAHHQGAYIRLAYADRLEGPWTTYAPGTLQLEQTPARSHIASPDLLRDFLREQKQSGEVPTHLFTGSATSDEIRLEPVGGGR